MRYQTGECERCTRKVKEAIRLVRWAIGVVQIGLSVPHLSNKLPQCTDRELGERSFASTFSNFHGVDMSKMGRTDSIWNRKRDLVYLVFFITHIPVMLGKVDYTMRIGGFLMLPFPRSPETMR